MVVAPQQGDVDHLVAVADHHEAVLVFAEAHQRRRRSRAVAAAVAVAGRPGPVGGIEGQPLAGPHHLVDGVDRADVDAAVVAGARTGAHPAVARVAVLRGSPGAVLGGAGIGSRQLDGVVVAEVAGHAHHPTVVGGHHEPAVEGDVDAHERPLYVVGPVPPVPLDDGAGPIGGIGLDAGRGVVLAAQEQGVVAVEQRVHPSSPVMKRAGDAYGVSDGIVAVKIVQPRFESLPVRPGR